MKTLVLKNVKLEKNGKTPFVLLPFKMWKNIENQLEDLEALASKNFRKKIAKARLEKKLYSNLQAKKYLVFRRCLQID